MLDLVIDYGGRVRFASLIHFDFIEVDGSAWAGQCPYGYEVVTQSYLEKFRARIEHQRERLGGYSEEMLERFTKAESLLRNLTDDQEDQQQNQG